MNSRMLAAFTDELESLTKEAVPIGGAIEEAGQAVKGYLVRAPGKLLGSAREMLGHPAEIALRLLHPIKGLKEGWHMYSPVAQIAHRAEELGFKSPQEAMQGLTTSHPNVQKLVARGIAPELAIKKERQALMGGGLTGIHQPYMLEGNRPLRQAWREGGVKGVAEQLSRGGWTGETKYTKYLPLGGKSWIPGYSAMALPGIIHPNAPSKSGEGGRGERIGGEIGSMAGMAMTGGLGIIPGTLGWALANKAGGRAGRVLDRLRAGATVGEAVHAPSPTEAAEQLAEIQKTYG